MSFRVVSREFIPPPLCFHHSSPLDDIINQALSPDNVGNVPIDMTAIELLRFIFFNWT